MAREAVAVVSPAVDAERRSAFIMEGTEAHIVGATTRKVDVIAHYLHYVRCVLNVLRCRFIYHCLKGSQSLENCQNLVVSGYTCRHKRQTQFILYHAERIESAFYTRRIAVYE